MGKPKGGRGGGGAGRGGGGRGKSSGKTVDAAALGLSGTTPAPSVSPFLSAGANPNPIGGMDPNMLSMMAMAGALGGNGSQNVNVAFSQSQLAQMMQLVQAGNAAQQANADAAKAKEIEDVIAKATKEKTDKIAALEAKINQKKKAAGSDRSELDTELEEGEEEGEEQVKASRGQKRKAKEKNKLDLARAAKADLEMELAKARAEAEIARQKATQMETTITLLREGGVGTPRTRSASDGAIDIVDQIQKAEQQAKVSTPVKQELQDIVAAQLAAIRKQQNVSKLDLNKEKINPLAP